MHSASMQHRLSRRHFLGLASTGVIAASLPQAVGGTLRKTGQPRLMLSLAAYSFREYFKDSAHPQEKNVPAEKKIDLFKFIDYCAKHGVAGAELTSYYFPADASDEFLLEVKRHAFLRGVELSGTAVGNSFTHPAGEKRDREIALVKRWIDRAALLGIPHVRVFAGNTERQSLEAAKKNCVAALQECCDYASRKGVFLGIENHGGIVAEADVLLEIVRSVDSAWLGINLDTANFHTDDPYADLERCAPFAVNVQVKTELRPRGSEKQATDLKRIISILRKANYQGYVVLEYEAEEDPFKAVPRTLATLKGLLEAPWHATELKR